MLIQHVFGRGQRPVLALAQTLERVTVSRSTVLRFFLLLGFAITAWLAITTLNQDVAVAQAPQPDDASQQSTRSSSYTDPLNTSQVEPAASSATAESAAANTSPSESLGGVVKLLRVEEQVPFFMQVERGTGTLLTPLTSVVSPVSSEFPSVDDTFAEAVTPLQHSLAPLHASPSLSAKDLPHTEDAAYAANSPVRSGVPFPDETVSDGAVSATSAVTATPRSLMREISDLAASISTAPSRSALPFVPSGPSVPIDGIVSGSSGAASSSSVQQGGSGAVVAPWHGVPTLKASGSSALSDVVGVAAPMFANPTFSPD